MNINPMSEQDYLCCGEVVLMPEGYFEAYQTLQETSANIETSITTSSEHERQQLLALDNSMESADVEERLLEAA